MTLLLLLACGGSEPLDQPLPPPDPPPQLTSADPGLIRQTGVVSEVHPSTRTFVLIGEGRRSIVHLADTGNLRLNGQPVLIDELKNGLTLWVEGKRQGDLLVTQRASDSPDWDAPIKAPAADEGPSKGPVAEPPPAADPPPVPEGAAAEVPPAPNP